MANLQYGDIVELPYNPDILLQIKGITDVAPIKYNSIDEHWEVVAQKDATHMLIVIDTGITKYIMIEIGKCENLYLLADALVE